MKILFYVFIQMLTYVTLCQPANQWSSDNQKLQQFLWSYSKIKATTRKPLIDFDAIEDWKRLGHYLSVNNDGTYFAYTIEKHDRGETEYYFNQFLVDSLVVQSTNTDWRMTFCTSQTGLFSGDGKQYIFQFKNDLKFLQLGSNRVQTIQNITSYKVSEQGDWIAWMVRDSDNLTLRNFSSKKEFKFTGVGDYYFDQKSRWLVCHSKTTKVLLLFNTENNAEKRYEDVEAFSFSTNRKAIALKTVKNSVSTLQYVNFTQSDPKVIWTKKPKSDIGTFNLDESGIQVAFIVIDSTDIAKRTVWYYKQGTNEAVCKLNDESNTINKGQIISDDIAFTDNGNYLRLTLEGIPLPTQKPAGHMAAVEIWNTKDIYLQSLQFKNRNKFATYKAIANVEDARIVFVESVDKKIDLVNGDFVLVKKDYSDLEGDRFWQKKLYKDSTWNISLKDGSSHLFLVKHYESFWFSPDGKWLVYCDAASGYQYYSYNLSTGQVKQLSVGVPDGQFEVKSRSGGFEQSSRSGKLAAWVENESKVLAYDSYDIWKLDLEGKQPAINITYGYGQAHNTVLNLLTAGRFSFDPLPILKKNEQFVLRAFNERDKRSGFYEKKNLNAGIPVELSMGKCFMNLIPGCQDQNLSNEGIMPIKAKNNRIWLVQRQSATEAPNYFATSDFEHFRRLTNLQPQAKYRWLTQELHTFSHLDGDNGRGILYKPEGFDSSKKYAVVIAFYRGFSNNMYQFRVPTYLDQAMTVGKSPVWFLNNGFLVFTPDIAVTPFQYGPKAFNVIEGAAKYLQQLPYVDGDKLGTASHSWSAKLGAYMFTHSKSIAATAISEGFLYGNVLNMAFSLNDGASRLEDVEQGQEYGSFWENKDAWLDQTTVLNVDKAKGPLLLFCNKQSTEDYQDQTFQFFTALRRLEKSAWWLKYDKGSHTLSDLHELRDYTIRYTQFFDHFLNNAPAPQWMTQGVPFKLKGIESRYDLDPRGSCNTEYGEPCLICQAWNVQYKKTPEMFQKDIKDWNLENDIAEELRQMENERRKELNKEWEEQTKEVMRMWNK